MKHYVSKFRIVLRALALGLAAVFIWQVISISRQSVPVELPKAQSGDVLLVSVPIEQKDDPEAKYLCDEFKEGGEHTLCLNRVIFESRDMSLYDNLGQQGCSFEELDKDRPACERSTAKARQFVWNHWTKRKRGYVAVAKASDGKTWTVHLFVEPAEEGKWRVVERIIPMLRKPEDPEHYWLGDLIEIKWETADESDASYGLLPGTKYLRLTNITGDSLIL